MFALYFEFGRIISDWFLPVLCLIKTVCVIRWSICLKWFFYGWDIETVTLKFLFKLVDIYIIDVVSCKIFRREL